jgi:leader peptidase (prepilin peptidase) / N-methyltransferase
MLGLAAFLLGLIVGSFLNVVVLRHKAKSLSGRSACFSCGTRITWYDLIPLFSWLNLRGRCRACGSRISVQYPLVEFATGALFFVVALLQLPILPTLVALFIVSISIAIAVYDIKHTIIPDSWVTALILASAFFPFTAPILRFESWQLYLLGAVVTALPLFLLWLVSEGRWMGLGDVKLALAIGFLLGPVAGPYAIMVAFILGALIMVPLLFFSSATWKNWVKGFTPTPIASQLVWGFTMKSEVPFGPYLIASNLLVWFALLLRIPLPILNIF